MSYILEALKKSQQERELGSVPRIQAVSFDETPPHPTSQLLAVCRVIVALCAVAIAYTRCCAVHSRCHQLRSLPCQRKVQVRRLQARRSQFQRILRHRPPLQPARLQTHKRSSRSLTNKAPLSAQGPSSNPLMIPRLRTSTGQHRWRRRKA